MTTPRPRDLPAIAARARRAAELLAADGRHAALLLEHWTLTTQPPPGPGVAGGDISDPTLAALTRTEIIRYGNNTFLQWVAQLEEASAAITSIITEVRTATATNKPPAERKLTIGICAERHCDAQLLPGHTRRGRCPACYHWVRRWELEHPGHQAPPVPATVIERRKADDEIRPRRAPAPGHIDAAD